MKDDYTGGDCLLVLPNLNACVFLLREERETYTEFDSVVILPNPNACVTLLGLR
jgi:hypothetical protein